MFKENCQITENRKVAPGHWVLSFKSKDLVKTAKPGQFVQILCQDSTEPLLPRPFSFLTVSKNNFSILYHVVGRGTEILSHLKKGDVLSVLGPCGNGFTAPKKSSSKQQKFFLVGGGVGIPPLYHFTEELLRLKVPAKNIHIFLGARDKSLLLCQSEFKKLKVPVHLATDNGSKGIKGFVTQVLENSLKNLDDSQVRIFTCGPTPMMKAVSQVAEKFQAPCEVSVEVPMACGFGACLGCAIKVKTDQVGEHRFAVACCEGPVFKGSDLAWD